ncbi:hypothetical protein JTB14_011051 [Gonioctena quinquepunctata]|nr:hypothetical protein JTB14_011051 [Gonioctena quinquepunctata]
MDCYDEKIKTSDTFKASTTYRNDYKKYCEYNRQFYNYEKQRQETPNPPPEPPGEVDHETFSKWQEGILESHSENSKRFQIGGREEAIKTRPRVYMTPAVSMDDIPDPEMRKLLCEHMYTSEWRRAEKEATASFKKTIPQIGKIETRDTASLKHDIYKPIGEKFRRAGKKWDDTQLRGYSDSTREFWIHKDPPVICGACVDPLKYIVPDDTKKTISSLIKEDKLRLSHDKTIPGYAGYRPMMPLGIPLAKVDLPTVHPFLSTTQAITNRYTEDLNK